MTPTPPSTSSSVGANSPEFRVIRKRNRVPLSCAPCRHRKLKCNRTHPCDNCVKRGDASSCSYSQPNARKKNLPQQTTPTSPDDMQNRIDRLEGLVLSLMTNGNQAAGPAAALAAISGESSAGSTGLSNELDLDEDIPEGAEESDTEQVTKSFGVMKVDNNKSYYISEAHWASVLNDISEVRNFFATHKKQLEEQAEKVRAARPRTDVPESTLLFGVMKPLSRAEIMASLPSKYTTDLLVARYFNSYDPATHILHGPTFQSQYNRHWEDPSQTELVWIAMLFAMMRLAMLSFHRERDEPPEFRGKAMDMAGSFRNSVAHCISLADYTKPHPYLIECLVFHLHGDFSQTREADVSVWVLTGVIARLAMRMGYHRDSKVFPNITPFQGEMRRRVWSFVRVSDVLFSFQVGMPSMLRASDTDTELPHNLYDDDFDEDCKELPQSRQLSEPTPISYLITKARLVFVFGRVNEHASSTSNSSYDKTMELDAELRQARESIPDHLRVRPMEECQLDPVQLIMSRHSAYTVYHKAQIVLHRPYLVRARENPRFTYSRRTCIDSAMDMLKAQSDMHAETRNGRLAGRHNLVTSLCSADFLLAATIVSLDLYQGYQHQAASRPSDDAYTWGRERRDEMTAALQHSKEIWDEMRDESMEAWKATSILGVMLAKLRSTVPGLETGTGNAMFEPQDEKQSAAMTLGLLSSGMSPINPGLSPFSDPTMRMTDSPMPAGAMGMGMGMGMGAGAPAEMPSGPLSPFSSMFGQMPDMQANLDWDAWDTYIQNPTFDTSNQFWPMMDSTGQTVQPNGLTQPSASNPLDTSRIPSGVPPMPNGAGTGQMPSMFSPSSNSESNGSSMPAFTPMHSLRRSSSRLLKSAGSHPTVISRLQCTVSPRFHASTLSTPTPFIPTRLVRWKSSTNQHSKTPQQDFNSSIPSKAQFNKYIEPEYELTPEEIEAYKNIHSEAEKDDVDYLDLYARSKAAEEEQQKDVSGAVGKRAGRLRALDEQLKSKSKDFGDPSSKSTTPPTDSKSATNSAKPPSTPSKLLPPRTEVPHETIYVGNLFFDLAAEDLRAHFEQFGTVLSTTIVHDNRGISKGFGYVQFSSVEEAKIAVEKQHMKVLGGRQVVLQYARNNIKPLQEEHDATNTVYLGGIPYELTDRDVQDLFSDITNVFDIRVPVDRRSGMLRGFAHVEFLDVEAARIGKEILARKSPYGRKMVVEFTNLKKVGMLHSERHPERPAEDGEMD
ncbi:hypothetical protein N7478_000249 [Penicillium angulare]|uniref:uncharacterized protein n=1 Tax=Penicillium angulare TaxID=116970 RepID=UPI002541AD41|nr:uncharacterized protein N7478_000249 [Penicillium angulare]KAJ5290998.1 hypothetical protein N7478_000249 [Penicillium angulare]